MPNLGILWVLYGLLRLVATLGIFLYRGTLTVMWARCSPVSPIRLPWSSRRCPRYVHPCCSGSREPEKRLGGIFRVHKDYTIGHSLAIRPRPWHAI